MSIATYLSKLLGHLHRVFDTDPKPLLALRIGYSGAWTWQVADETLTVTVINGPGATFALPLAGHTLGSLASAIDAQPGFSIRYLAAEIGGLSATILLDAGGGSDTSNGDHLYAYTSLLWALLRPVAATLTDAQDAIPEAIDQIALDLADGSFADLHGSYYGFARLAGEGDADYIARIVASVLMPRNNNVAIQLALARQLGCAPSAIRVLDANAVELGGPSVYDGTWNYDGTRWFNGRTVAADLDAYRCQFSVVLLGEVATGEALDALIPVINAFKAAGTHLLHIYNGAPLVYDGTWNYDGAERFNGRILT